LSVRITRAEVCHAAFDIISARTNVGGGDHPIAALRIDIYTGATPGSICARLSLRQHSPDETENETENHESAHYSSVV